MKVKYDKKANKYHILFDKKKLIKEKKEVYFKLNSKYAIQFIFDTEIDGKKEEIEREKDAQILKEILIEMNIDYNIEHREIEISKKIFGIPTSKKIKATHYKVKANIPKNNITEEIIDFFIGHELKIYFKIEESEEEFYDSSLFSKFYSSYDLSKI